MKKGLKVAAVIVATLLVCAAALAEEGTTRRRGGRPEFARSRKAGAQQADGRRRPGGPRMEMLHKLLNSQEGKALRDQLRKDIESIHADRKALMEKVRAEIEGGKKPQDVLPQYRDQFRALTKKRLLLTIEFREKLLGVARKNVDKAVDTIHQRIRHQMRNRRGKPGEKGGDTDAPRRRFQKHRRRRPGDAEHDDDAE